MLLLIEIQVDVEVRRHVIGEGRVSAAIMEVLLRMLIHGLLLLPFLLRLMRREHGLLRMHHVLLEQHTLLRRKHGLLLRRHHSLLGMIEVGGLTLVLLRKHSLLLRTLRLLLANVLRRDATLLEGLRNRARTERLRTRAPQILLDRCTRHHLGLVVYVARLLHVLVLRLEKLLLLGVELT